MKAILLAAALILPGYAFAGGGGGAYCKSDVIAQCQTKDGNSLVDIVQYNCDDDSGNFWAEYALDLNLPNGVFSVDFGTIENGNPFDVSSKRDDRSFTWSEGRDNKTEVKVEMAIKSMRGNLEIKAEDDGRTLVNADLLCRSN